jgi:hypothetical protein
LECISTVKADFEHAAIEAKVGIFARRFQVEVVPECQAHEGGFRCRNTPYVEVLVADSGWVVDPRGIGLRISGRDRHTGIRCLPQNTIGVDPIRRRPSGRQSRRRHVVEIFVQNSD